MEPPAALRQHVVRLLGWTDAHAGYDAAVGDLPAPLRGIRPPGLPHSAWELAEHLRITQHDILGFCQAPQYQELRWPDQYWPATPAPPSAEAWDESVSAFQADRGALRRLAQDERVDLLAVVPHGTDQTYLRELLLVADHTAYHVGQLILVRRLLGAWPAS